MGWFGLCERRLGSRARHGPQLAPVRNLTIGQSGEVTVTARWRLPSAVTHRTIEQPWSSSSSTGPLLAAHLWCRRTISMADRAGQTVSGGSAGASLLVRRADRASTAAVVDIHAPRCGGSQRSQPVLLAKFAGAGSPRSSGDRAEFPKPRPLPSGLAYCR